MLVVVVVSPRKSSKTVLLHLGHLGSSSESMTYIKHLGQPTRTIEVASGLEEYLGSCEPPVAGGGSLIMSSDDRHELGGEIEGERVGDSGPTITR